MGSMETHMSDLPNEPNPDATPPYPEITPD